MSGTIGSEIFDSRDVIERIAELEAIEDRDTLDQEELDSLVAFAEEASGYASDWEDGETIIRDDYFVQYAEQLAEDIGAISPDASWPLSYIDWDAAADALRMDYTAVELDGTTYWVR